MLQNRITQVRHRFQNRRLRIDCDGFVRSVAPSYQHCSEACGLRGCKIDNRISAIKSIGGRAADRFESQQSTLWGRLSCPFGRTADDRYEMLCEVQLAEYPFAKKLRLVGTDRHANAGRGQCLQRLPHARKGQIGGNFNDPVNGAELLDLPSRVGRVRTQRGGDHRLPADRVHAADQRAIGARLRAAFGKHCVDDRSGQPGAIDQSSI